MLTNDDLARIVHINDDGDYPGFTSVTVRGTFRAADGGAGLKERLRQICTQVSEAIEDGARLIVLSQRGVTKDFAPIPSLLLTGAVHQHLVRERTRTRVGLVVEAGDAREVHHIALLIGYGAAAVNPYLAMATVEDLAMRGDIAGVDCETAAKNLVKALAKGVRKTMSKIGVSTVASYTGAQIFEAVGLGRRGDRRVLHRHHLAAGRRRLRRARRGGAHPPPPAPSRPTTIRAAHRALDVGGEYQWRREGELHLFNPTTVFKLQHSTRQGRYEIFKEYTRAVDDQAHKLMTLRGLFRFKGGARPPVDIDEVEPVDEIVKRFATGAISYGSISKEMHETLAIAMNRLGGKSNTGEGGEDADRYTPDANGDNRRSAIKQVASGRFGVTSEYLVNADDLQIKISQGAKPGEGGQLPGGQGLPVDREDPVLDAGRRADLTAAAPRHLLHRGHQAAHPRPQERQPGRARAREAREPGRRRHRGRGRGEGVLRRRADLRARRRHRRVAAVARSSTRAGRGSWGWPRPSRPCCATVCATGSWCRPTASSRPAATSSSPRCWAPRSSASPPPRWW